VIVFFETEAKMQDFEWYLRDHNVRMENMHVVTQARASHNVSHYVKQATRKGTTTLFSRIHGRGLDFVCHDATINTNGGIHVIQTFLSEEESEEIQIRGRSARQDKNGTYKLLMLADDLAKYELNMQSDLSYKALNAARHKYCDDHVANRKTDVDSALVHHAASMKFADDLRGGNFDLAMDFANKHCAYRTGGNSGPKSVMFVVDFSGSMSSCDGRGLSRIAACVQAIAMIFDEHIQSEDHIAITLFDSQIHSELGWKKKSGNEDSIRNTIVGCNRTRGMTCMWNAVQHALGQSGSAPSAYWIILLCDGDSSGDSTNPQQLATAIAAQKQAGTLAGLIAITAGSGVSASSRQQLATLAQASGVDDGVISAGSNDKIKEAFGTAAAIMSGAIGRGRWELIVHGRKRMQCFVALVQERQAHGRWVGVLSAK
jgi:Mg-chelatase subunit ChlD